MRLGVARHLFNDAEVVPDLLALIGSPSGIEPVIAHVVLTFDWHMPEHAFDELRLG